MPKRNLKAYPQEGFAVTCRGLQEYLDMMGLSLEDLTGPVLDVAGGMSSFRVELAERGIQAAAADPIYGTEPAVLERKLLQETDTVYDKLEAMKDQYDWTYYGSIERHKEGRLASGQKFIDDYSRCFGSSESPYLPAELPDFSFLETGRYRHIVCSHFLFLYGDRLDYSFHLDTLRAMRRALAPDGEIRLYPLRTLRWEMYPELNRLLGDLGGRYYTISSRLPFIPRSSDTLVIKKS